MGNKIKNGTHSKHVLMQLLIFIGIIVSMVNGREETDGSLPAFGKLRIPLAGEMGKTTGNPAALGIRSCFRKMVPYRNSLSAGYWSDKLALTPYREYLSISDAGNRQKLVERLINESFGVAGNSAVETSRKITEKITGGMSVYGISEMEILGITLDNFDLDVRTSGVFQIDFPDAPFLVLFSSENGLKSGTDLSLKSMGATMLVTTDIDLTYGNSLNPTKLAEKINAITGNRTDFKEVAWGLGMTFSLGNSYMNLSTIDGGIQMNEEGTEIVADADMVLKTTGAGLENNWKFRSPLEESPRIVGWGAGINAGILLYGGAVSAGISLRRFGPMLWKDVQKADITFRTRTLSAVEILTEEIIGSGYDLFDSTDGGTFPDAQKGDTLKKSENILCWQPASITIGLGYTHKFSKKRDVLVTVLSNYISTTFEYDQSLVRYPGRSFLPRVGVGVENGTFYGIVPIRAGLSLGGSEKITSTAGFSLHFPFFSFQASYMAVGTPYWYPKRGFVASMGLSSGWFTPRESGRMKMSRK